MSLSFIDDKKEAIPIAVIKKINKIVYMYPNDKTFMEIPDVNIRAHQYFCPYCKKELKSKEAFIYHVNNKCPEKGTITTKAATVKTQGELIQKLPLNDHEIIFVTGPPKCGKSYWLNEYAKAYKSIFDGKIFLFTTHDSDETLADDMGIYTSIAVSDELLTDPFDLNDFKKSLVIFDDINSSRYPKASKYLLGLMDDIAKNGRHYEINMIYVNQECRCGKMTKAILTMLTTLVVFPSSGETYQIQRLLKDYAGMSKARINKIMALDTRWVMFSRPRPQYVLYETGCFILGKELYG